MRRNLEVDAGEGVEALGRGQVDLIERNLFVVLGVKIGEDLGGHEVIAHLDGRATVFEDHGERLV